MMFSTSSSKSERPMSKFWLLFWAVALAFAWLLPNHYMPWTGFHADAWAAVVLGLGSVFVIWHSSSPVSWHYISVLTAALIVAVIIQYVTGIIPFAGQAWLGADYLVGFLLALLIGARWEEINKDQLANALFFSIGIASILSVGLQFFQWFGLDGLHLMMVKMTGNRPFANLGQPNQLGTLLLWGVLACIWGVVSGKIRLPFALLLVAILLFGVALTQSRTAWIGFSIIILSAWCWRRFWPAKNIFLILLCASCYFVFCNLILPWLGASLEINKLPAVGDRFSGEIRPIAWRLFLEATWQRPWFGYGFTEVAQAQLDLSLKYPVLGGAFGQAHNIFLDLLLWFGLPIGLFVCAFVCCWIVKCILSVKDGKDAILITTIAVIGNHALLELPLHYAYFLLPTGLLIGVINVRLGHAVLFRTSMWQLFSLWLFGVALLILIVYDYFRVEANFNGWLYERANIGIQKIIAPPDVFVLTQLREKMRFARLEVKDELNDEQLEWMRKVVRWSPSAFELHKLATALALSGKPAEAEQWLKKLCKVTSSQQCELVGRVWSEQAINNEKIAKIKWADGTFLFVNNSN